MLVRGLPNVVTLLNGRQVFTTTGRFIALGDVPANLLQGVDVYKSNGASQVEGGIAGTIDVHTRRAFDNPGTHVNVNARGPYNDKSDKLNPNLGLTLSKTWGQTFGALAGFSYIGNRYHEERAFNVEFVDQSGAGGAFGPGNPAADAAAARALRDGLHPDRRRPKAHGGQLRPPMAARRALPSSMPTASSRSTRTSSSSTSSSACRSWATARAKATVNPGTNILHTLQNNNVFTITSTQANDNSSLTQQYAVGGSKASGSVRLSTDLSYTKSEVRAEEPHPRHRHRGAAGRREHERQRHGPAQLRRPELRHHHRPGLQPRELVRQPPHRQRQRRRLARRRRMGRPGQQARREARGRCSRRRSQRRLDRQASRAAPGAPVTGTAPGLGVPRPGLRFRADGVRRARLHHDAGGSRPAAATSSNNTGTIRQAFTGTTAPKPLDPGTFFDMKEKTYAGYGQANLRGALGTRGLVGGPWRARRDDRREPAGQSLAGHEQRRPARLHARDDRHHTRPMSCPRSTRS